MKKELKKTYKLTNQIFSNINHFCKDCNTCCKTYGWLLKEEADEFSKKGYPVVKINNNLYCIDSFARNKNAKLILDKIPRCVYYKNRRCLIHQERPLDCRLYPIKIRFNQNKIFIGLSLGCKYVFSLSKKEKNKIYQNIINFFEKSPKSVINEYLDLIYQINSISQPKQFWMKKIIEIKKQNSCWKIIKLNL
jgi:Fe-S-cluster containining protein